MAPAWSSSRGLQGAGGAPLAPRALEGMGRRRCLPWPLGSVCTLTPLHQVLGRSPLPSYFSANSRWQEASGAGWRLCRRARRGAGASRTGVSPLGLWGGRALQQALLLPAPRGSGLPACLPARGEGPQRPPSTLPGSRWLPVQLTQNLFVCSPDGPAVWQRGLFWGFGARRRRSDRRRVRLGVPSRMRELFGGVLSCCSGRCWCGRAAPGHVHPAGRGLQAPAPPAWLPGVAAGAASLPLRHGRWHKIQQKTVRNNTNF